MAPEAHIAMIAADLGQKRIKKGGSANCDFDLVRGMEPCHGSFGRVIKLIVKLETSKATTPEGTSTNIHWLGVSLLEHTPICWRALGLNWQLVNIGASLSSGPNKRGLLRAENQRPTSRIPCSKLFHVQKNPRTQGSTSGLLQDQRRP